MMMRTPIMEAPRRGRTRKTPRDPTGERGPLGLGAAAADVLLRGNLGGQLGGQLGEAAFDAPSAAEPSRAAVRVRASRLNFVALPLFLADAAAMALTCGVAWLLTDVLLPLPTESVPGLALAMFVPVALGNLLTGLYPGTGLNPVVEFRQLSRVSAIAFLGTVALVAMSATPGRWAMFFGLAWAVQFFAAPLARAATRRLCRDRRWWGYPTLVFGGGNAARHVVECLTLRRECGLKPVAVLCPRGAAGDGDGRPRTILGVPVAGRPRLGFALARQLHVRHAVVAAADLLGEEATRSMRRYARGIRHVMLVAPDSACESGLPILWRDTRDLAGVAGVEVRNRLLVPTPRLIKRGLDLALTLAGGLVLLPLLGVVALAVKLSSRGPIFFGHTRLGHRGARFKAWKFRSMRVDSDRVLAELLAGDPLAREAWARDHKLKDDPRVTRVGAFLRKTSLDELPQLWNVLRGEMSLVGPRPIVRDEVAKYGKCYATYKAVRPGITGLWQVSGRSDTTYGQRLEFDEFYVRNWSPWLDMHILARTIFALGGSRGAY